MGARKGTEVEQTVEQHAHGELVGVLVDDTDACPARIILAAREAVRQEVPLELIEPSTPGEPAPREQRALHLERLDNALAIARQAAPGVDVRILCESPPPSASDQSNQN